MPSRSEIRNVVNRESDVAKILTLHPIPATLCLRHIVDCRDERNVLFGIAQAKRSREEQAAIFAIGRNEHGAVVDRKRVVTWAPPGFSFHEYALAYDVCLLRPKRNAEGFYEVEWSGIADLDADDVRDYLEIGLSGECIGMEWGGRWPRRKTDEPHFEYTPDLPIEVAVSRFPNGLVPDDYFSKKPETEA